MVERRPEEAGVTSPTLVLGTISFSFLTSKPLRLDRAGAIG